MKPQPADVRCDYCGQQAEFSLTSAHLYHGFNYGPVWQCLPCQAWVGCHPDDRPLGRLANKALRMAKQAAHAAFDPLVAGKIKRDGCSKKQGRNAGYKWLAEQLGLTRETCHIGMFDEAMCSRVIEVCTNRSGEKDKAA